MRVLETHITPARTKPGITTAGGTRTVVVAALAVAAGYLAMLATHQRGQTKGGPHIPAGEGTVKDSALFQEIPPDLVVRLRVVTENQQRYDTSGDWLWSGATLEIRISREVVEEDPRYATLLFVHELVEALLCRSTGVSGAQVDAFDMAHQQAGEPGDNPAAPYHRQHLAAQAAERALAEQLGVNWDTYLGR
jgi:hypothetical protein